MQKTSCKEDILCEECAEYYIILLDLLANDPYTLIRLRKHHDWCEEKTRLAQLAEP
ncbi:MAG TPA: hypothetical protein VLV31_00335 [Candidatus Acidoferrales bacterium]|nr:hypothetical protein [Candidatus Acidoferrales bacterium]